LLTHLTCSADSIFGTTIVSGFVANAAARSNDSKPEPMLLIRIQRSDAPKSNSFIASAMTALASVLRVTATPSSISMQIQSTPSVVDFSILRRSSPGM
jgi:hypothetical protein